MKTDNANPQNLPLFRDNRVVACAPPNATTHAIIDRPPWYTWEIARNAHRAWHRTREILENSVNLDYVTAQSR